MLERGEFAAKFNSIGWRFLLRSTAYLRLPRTRVFFFRLARKTNFKHPAVFFNTLRDRKRAKAGAFVFCLSETLIYQDFSRIFLSTPEELRGASSYCVLY